MLNKSELSHRRGFIGKALVVGALAAAFVAGPLVAAPAMADGSGCALTHGFVGSTTCLAVIGSGTYVQAVTINHSHGPSASCEFQSRIRGTLVSGSAWSSTYGYSSQCTLLPYYNNLDIRSNFKKGTNMRGDTWHDGAWAPGVPTVAIQ
jgi:hypothetical protein